MAGEEKLDGKFRVIETYSVKTDDLTIEVNIFHKPNEFVTGYYLNFPSYGAGTSALLANLKKSLVEETIARTGTLEPQLMEKMKNKFKEKAKKILDLELPKESEETKTTLIGVLIHEMLGLGRIEFLLSDGNLEEVVINKSKEPIWVYHKKYGWLKTNVLIEKEEDIENYANIIARRVGKQITILSPLLDAHLVTGDRANATLFPISSHGNTITIRRFRRDPWTVTDFIRARTVSAELMALIWQSMEYELNMIISGGTASGKCVSGDTKILASNREKTIKEIVESELEHSAPQQTEDGFWTTPSKIEIFSFNPETAQIEKAIVSRVWKRSAPEQMIRITTQTGKQLEVTSEHPFFVLDGTLVKKRADELNASEFIAAARQLEIESLPEKQLQVPLNIPIKIKNNGNEKWIRPKLRSNKWVKMPVKMSCELARLIGYILGDGHINKARKAIRFFNKDSQLREDFSKCGENIFGIKAKHCFPKNKCPYIEFNSRVCTEFLIQNFNIIPGKKSHLISIPEALLFGKKEYLKECIRGLFESEASVDAEKGELEFSSSSRIIIQDLSTALHRFGILHCLKKKEHRNRLFIRGKPLQQFGFEIGFLRAEKNDQILMSKKKTFSPNIDFIPNAGKTLAELKSRLRLHEREMKGRLSRETISRYINLERDPTRESLMPVANLLEKRFFELKEEKENLERLEKYSEETPGLIGLVKTVYNEINETRKSMALKTGFSPVSLWLWESGRVKPEAARLREFAEITCETFDDYWTALQEPVSSIEDARKLGMAVTDLSEKTGHELKSLYNCLEGKPTEKALERLLPGIAEWQNEKKERLKSIQEQVQRIRKILSEGNVLKLDEARKRLGKKLKAPSNQKKANQMDFIHKKLEEAVSTETFQKITWLKNLASSNIVWDKITKIEKVKPKEKWVYDLTVEKNHTFLANNLVAHNTSFLNICMPFIQPNHRILSLEDTRELMLPDFLHWVPLTTREPNPEGKGAVSMLDLLVNSLRMRPDRVIVGEVRRQKEAEVMFEAMHTGHSVYTTIHANTADETITRLVNPPVSIPVSMLDAVHLNIVMFRNRRLGTRRALEVAEFIPEKRGKDLDIKPNVIYRWKSTDDNIVQHNESIRLFDELSLHTGLSYNEIKQELAKKTKILDWMIKYDVHNVNDVGKVMAQFYEEPDVIFGMAEKNKKPEL